MKHIASFLFLMLAYSAFCAAPVLFSDTSAHALQAQAFPLGNGTLGALNGGNPFCDTTVFTLNSLRDPDSHILAPLGTARFIFTGFSGGLKFFHGKNASIVSGQNISGDNPASQAFDGDLHAHASILRGDIAKKPVVLQFELDKPEKADFYTIFGVPPVQGDPRTWTLEGSADAKQWTEIDSMKDNMWFSRRFEPYVFKIAKPGEYKFYRFNFHANHGSGVLQLGEIMLVSGKMPGPEETLVSGYSRRLSLEDAVQTAEFEIGGVKVKKEFFISHPAKVAVMKITAEGAEKGAVPELSGSFDYSDFRGAKTEAVLKSEELVELRSVSSLGKTNYACEIIVFAPNSKLNVSGSKVEFRNLRELYFVLAAATDFSPDPKTGFRTKTAPLSAVLSTLEKMEKIDYADLKKQHIADCRSLFDRSSLDPEESPAVMRGVPISSRVQAFSRTLNDPDFYSALFHYGRYLLISGSRGDLPLSSGGLWKLPAPVTQAKKQPAAQNPFMMYRPDGHTQMLYWCAEPSGIPETLEPFFDLFDRTDFSAPRSELTQYGEFRGEEFPLADAWIAMHYFDRWDFSRDRKFLSERAFPFLKKAVLRNLPRMKKNAEGRYLVCGIRSPGRPEDKPSDGNAFAQAVMWRLLTDFVTASEVLKDDPALRSKVQEIVKGMPSPKIGGKGTLQEWFEDRDNPDDTNPTLPQMFAVYPAGWITPDSNPDGAICAYKTLELKKFKPENNNPWFWLFRAAQCARLAKSEGVRQNLIQSYRNSMRENMMTFHSQFGMEPDAVCAGAAVLCEALLQSDGGVLRFLPAVPQNMRTGKASGLRARGGFLVDLEWTQGPFLTKALIRTTLAEPSLCTVAAGGKNLTVSNSDGSRTAVKVSGDRISFTVEPGKTYLVKEASL